MWASQSVYNMSHKVYDDAKCDYAIALAWAINVKNYLINNGFNPSQLVFGWNCNLTNTLHNTLPVLDESNH